MNTVKVICLDATYRPPQIPKEKWLVKNEWYTLTFVAFCKPQLIQGCSLYEKPLGEDCKPYEYFRLKRFGILESDLPAFEALLNECTGMNDIDVNELYKENGYEMPKRLQTI